MVQIPKIGLSAIAAALSLAAIGVWVASSTQARLDAPRDIRIDPSQKMTHVEDGRNPMVAHRLRPGTQFHFAAFFYEGKEDAMADDLSKKGPQDRSRINSDEDYELRYWCQKFGVSEALLKGGGGEGWQLSRSCREGVARRAQG